MRLPSLRASGAGSRRNTITREDMPLMAAVTAAAAIAAAFAGCRPTGNVVGDVLCTAGLVAFTSWMAATASWWALTIAGFATVALATGSVVPIICGLAAAAIGLWLGDRRASLPALRCASAALALQGLLRLELRTFFGASALLAGGVVLFLIGIGLQRRRRAARVLIIKRLLIGLAASVAVVAAFGLSAATSSDDLRVGYQGLLDGLSELRDGDPAAAATTLHETAAHLRSAQDGIDAVWTQPSRLVPVVAQHQQALAGLVEQAATSAEAAADALDVVDFDALTVDGGVIDVSALEILAEPLGRLERAVSGLQAAMNEQDSPWLVAPLADRLHRYQRRADDAARQAATIHTAAVVGPAMLGNDEARRYFIGFASPAEARGTIGVMGNFAIITIDNGAISRSEFGRINDLTNQLLDNQPFSIEASDEFHAHYANNGAGRSNSSPASPKFISNVTMTPDMPSLGPVLAQLWVAAGHRAVDGVILLDPTALAGLLEATGPVTVPGLDAPLSSGTVEQFLLLDQYSLDTPERRDLLEDVADATLDAVLGGSLPAPQHLAKALGPAAADGHLLMWVPAAEEQALLAEIGIDGALPSVEGRDGFAVVTNNATANKIDSFLERSVTYHGSYDQATGQVTATMTIALTNTAPASGYPDYVIDSEFLDLPPGTNRTLLTVFSPLAQLGTTVDGEPSGMSGHAELGWNAYTLELDLAPGETRTVVVTLVGNIGDGPYELVVRPQALARDDRIDIQIGGDTAVHFVGAITRRTVVDDRGARTAR
ncbi:MAG: DUF4012 domain-containing protein [Ilumatobacteraceae bacterium]